MDEDFEYGPDVVYMPGRLDQAIDDGATCPTCQRPWSTDGDVVVRDGRGGRTYYCQGCMMMHRGVLRTDGVIRCRRGERMRAEVPDWLVGEGA